MKLHYFSFIKNLFCVLFPIEYILTITIYLCSLNSNIVYSQDYDNDSILDNVDLDDDNDGILDEDEYYCPDVINWVNFGSPYTTSDFEGIITKNDGNNITVSTTGFRNIDNKIPDYSNFSAYADAPSDRKSLRVDDAGIVTINFSEPVTDPYLLISGLGETSRTQRATFSTPYQEVYTSSSGSVIYASSTVVLANDGMIVIRFPGTHTSISVERDLRGIVFFVVGIECGSNGQDVDGDGLANHLDLDSDGDGCSDANEAYGDPNADGGDGGEYGVGSPVTNANGTVNGASYTTGYVPSVYKSSNTTVCPINTNVDLDDDNDGILDEDEYYCPDVINWVNFGSPYTTSDFEGIITKNDGNDITVSTTGFRNIDNKIPDYSNFSAYADAPSDRKSLRVNDAGIVTINFSEPVTDPYLLISGLGGTSRTQRATFSTPYQEVYTSSSGSVIYASSTVVLANDGMIVIRFPGTHTSISVERDFRGNVFFVVGIECGSNGQDVDGDGLANHLDLDSDGDGCNDANEAYGDPNADGGDGGEYGVGSPVTNANGTVNGASYTTGYVSSVYINSLVNTCDPGDFDGDNILDTVDLDSDNDGILNNQESICNENILWSEMTSSTSGAISKPDGFNILISSGGFRNLDNTTPGHANFSSYGDKPSVRESLRTELPGTFTITFSEPVTNPYLLISQLGTASNTQRVTFSTAYQEVFTSSTGNVYYANSTILMAQNGHLVIRFPGTHTSISFTKDFRENSFFVMGIPCSNYDLDTDNDGIVDKLDLDSDNDGCSDANEAYGDSNADGGDSGVYGIDPADPSTIVDGNGRVIAASYAAPVDVDLNGIYEFQRAGDAPTILIAPIDSEATEGETIVLTTQVSGTLLSYTWQVNDGNGFVDIDPSDTTDQYQGSDTNELTISDIQLSMDQYQYRVLILDQTYICSTSSSEVLITVNPLPDNDLDGIADVIDQDDDNDGIADLEENIMNLDPSADNDSDGILNYLDVDDIGNGTPASCPDNNNDGVCDEVDPLFDSDGDSIPDHFDLDSDNDGCSDANEAYGDSNADGGDSGVFGIDPANPSTIVDSNGRVIAASYDSPVDFDLNGVYEFQETGGVPSILVAPFDTEAIEGENIVLTTQVSGTLLSYTWQVNDGNGFVDIDPNDTTDQYQGSDTNELTIQSILQNMDGYQYRVRITSDLLVCDEVISNVILITLRPDITETDENIKIYNSFSPNNDGINDVFTIKGVHTIDNTLQVYNRWGTLVYQTNNYGRENNFFSGISNGRLTVNQDDQLPVGTYFYIFEYEPEPGKELRQTGYIYLNR